jgi:AcrR family transcriptional regulator
MNGDESSTREEILTAALALARKRGIAAVTMVDAAKAAGITRQTVYFYFKNRTGLLSAMMRHEDLTHALAPRLREVALCPPSVKTFETFVKTWFRFVPDVVTVALAVQAESVSDDVAREAWRMRQDSLLKMIGRILSGIEADGGLKPEWRSAEAAEWTYMHLDPANYHNMVGVRGWSASRFSARTLETLKRELFDL